jgi:hypothetical protein
MDPAVFRKEERAREGEEEPPLENGQNGTQHPEYEADEAEADANRMCHSLLEALILVFSERLLEG